MLKPGCQKSRSPFWGSDAQMHSELTPDDLLALDLDPGTGETVHAADGHRAAG